IDANLPYAEVLEEYTPGGAIQVSYVYGNDLISQNRAGSKSFYAVDGLGSTRALTNASGVVTDRYTYDAFGRTISQVGSTVNDYLFAGQQVDPTTSLYNLRARSLDPLTGRFLSRDSYNKAPFSSNLNRYLFVGANPINLTDPSGHVTLIELLADLTIQDVIDSIQTVKGYTQICTARTTVQAIGDITFLGQIAILLPFALMNFESNVSFSYELENFNKLSDIEKFGISYEIKNDDPIAKLEVDLKNSPKFAFEYHQLHPENSTFTFTLGGQPFHYAAECCGVQVADISFDADLQLVPNLKLETAISAKFFRFGTVKFPFPTLTAHGFEPEE